MNDTATNNTAVEATYTFRPYDPQLPIVVPEGQRLVKCLYKTPKGADKPPHSNEYILVPTAHLSDSILRENTERLLPYIASFLQDVEDKLVKEAHRKASKGFGDSWFSLDKILAALDAEGKSGRLKKEDIENWFDASMLEPLIAAFAEKLGMDGSTDEQLEKLEAIVGAYRAKFASLASGKTFYKEEDRNAMLRALEVTHAADTEIGERMKHRLENMKAPEDLLTAL